MGLRKVLLCLDFVIIVCLTVNTLRRLRVAPVLIVAYVLTSVEGWSKYEVDHLLFGPKTTQEESSQVQHY